MEDELKIPEEHLGHKRIKYSSWVENFMLHALVAAYRSKDPNSQVGACIVDNHNRILSTGYNGAPDGWNDDDFPWDRDTENPIHTKYPYVIHAEMNALLNYKGDNKDLIGSTAFVSLFPCSNCAKSLVQAGVKKVVYLSDKYKGLPDNIAAKICFKYCGVEYEEFPKELRRDLLVSLRDGVGVREVEEVTFKLK